MISPVVLAGIAAGALVFVGSLVAVYLLLRYGGSFDRMAREAAGLPATLGEQKPLLYDALLATSRALPPRPAPLPGGKALSGSVVRVRDFQEEDIPLLFAVSNGQPRPGVYRDMAFDADEMIWKHLAAGPFGSLDAFRQELARDRGDARHYTLCDRSGKNVVGLLTLGEHSPRDLRVAIDCVWLTPAFQGSGSSGGDHAGALVETVLLVLTHLFDAGYRRVEWRCDGHNVRARRAGHSLGFVFEGVLRKHRIVKDCNCDTVVFAAINSEWPVMRGHLEARLESLTSRAVTADEEDKKTR